MGDSKDFCSQHSGCEARMDNMEKKIKEVEDAMNNRIDNFKNDTQKEMDGIKSNASSLENAVDSLNVTVGKLEVVVNNFTDFMKEIKETKMATKTSFIYPLILCLLTFGLGILGAILVK
jgi:type II secretory pathway component PulF